MNWMPSAHAFTPVVVCWVVVMILIFSTFAARGIGQRDDIWNRLGWTALGACLLLALSARNPWAGALIALHGLGLMFLTNATAVLRLTIYPSMLYIAGYLVLAQLLERWMVEPILWTFAGLGFLLACWCCYALTREDGFQDPLPWPFLIYEPHAQSPRGGQGQFNHAQALAALAFAAALGLLWIGRPAAGVLLPILLLPIWICQNNEAGAVRHPSQGLVHIVVALLGVMMLFHMELGLTVLGMAAAAIVMVARPWDPRKDWWDSQRFAHWKLALAEIWAPVIVVPDIKGRFFTHFQAVERIEQAMAEHKMDKLAGDVLLGKEEQAIKDATALMKYIGNMEQTPEERAWAIGELREKDRARCWQRWLFGFGTGTWYTLTLPFTSTRQKGLFYVTAHCEFIEQLVEHGVIGLVVLLGYLGFGLVRCFTGGPEGQAVFLMALTMCSIAAVSFPWMQVREVTLMNGDLQKFGAPALLAMTMILAALAELF